MIKSGFWTELSNPPYSGIVDNSVIRFVIKCTCILIMNEILIVLFSRAFDDKKKIHLQKYIKISKMANMGNFDFVCF